MNTNYFMDCDPETVPPDNELRWFSAFKDEILYILYNEKYALDLGGGRKRTLKVSLYSIWSRIEDFEPLLTIETRNLHEVADAIDKITWGVSQGILPSSDPMFSLEQITPPFRLQPLKIYHAWKIEREPFH